MLQTLKTSAGHSLSLRCFICGSTRHGRRGISRWNRPLTNAIRGHDTSLPVSPLPFFPGVSRKPKKSSDTRTHALAYQQPQMRARRFHREGTAVKPEKEATTHTSTNTLGGAPPRHDTTACSLHTRVAQYQPRNSIVPHIQYLKGRQPRANPPPPPACPRAMQE